MLIAFAGLSGAGKTTIARILAQRLGAAYLRIDTIEQALRSSRVLKKDVGPSGYVVAQRVAEENLRIGRIVVADSVNPLQVTRDAWRAVAERASTDVIEIEVICSDVAEHRRRVEARQSDIEGLEPPEWQAVATREYETWDRPHIVIDTASRAPQDNVAELLARLSDPSAAPA
jgi:predicted kinase